jgi:transcriptional regulator with XRE-family HTH domain
MADLYTDNLTSIDLNLREKLQDRAYRTKFFRALAQDEIASQIRELRGLRSFRQVDLAKAANMKQSAVSRIEQADYSSWNFMTLLRVAEALDARVRIIFQISEDAIKEFVALGEEQDFSIEKGVLANPEPSPPQEAAVSAEDMMGLRHEERGILMDNIRNARANSPPSGDDRNHGLT